MSLNRGTVNALSVLGFRKLSFIPEHFARLSIDHRIDVKAVEYWIEYNLNSRYSVQINYGLDHTRKILEITEIGMEDPKELTMLSLGCHHLHKKIKDNF
jgi:hypothetical protein